jgi:hypothetical protein
MSAWTQQRSGLNQATALGAIAQLPSIPRPPPIGGLNGFSFSTATAGYELDPPISLSSSLVHSSRASLILYSWERISDTTTTSRF